MCRTRARRVVRRSLDRAGRVVAQRPRPASRPPLRGDDRGRRRRPAPGRTARAGMKVLAIDGALGAFSVALSRDGALLASESAGGNVALELGLSLVAAA